MVFYRDYTIYSSPFVQSDSCASGCIIFYCEINRPVEGWENLLVFQHLKDGSILEPQYIQKYSREKISIPVSIFTIKNKVVKKEATMFVYNILYKEGKVQFESKLSF